jgi:AcrR family transcriptional regulator
MTVAKRSSEPLGTVSVSVRGEGSSNGFGHAQVAQIQRARILAAMFDVATERGAMNVSVADVVERSGVSRRTFYETFPDREACFLAAFEDALAFASRRVLPAYQGEHWRDRIRAGVVAFLCFLDEERVIGRLLVCESLTGSPQTRARRERVLVQLAAAIDSGREESKNTALLPPLTAEGLVGGVLSIIDARLSLSEDSTVIGLANTIISMIVLPYLGLAAASRELERPVKTLPGDGRDTRLLEDPFKDAGMRLTYRTVRVLLAITELVNGQGLPGPSNRMIGETAGIRDQGQISKVLARLQRLGLILNTGLGPGLGAPNQWSLTDTGRQIINSIHAYTPDTDRNAR